MNAGTSVAEVMAFARSDGVLEYDEIAARVCAASAFAGPSPLHTLAGETRHRPTPDALKRRRLSDLREAARPLSFEVELPSDGRLAYEFTRDEIRLRLRREGRTVLRRMSIGHPLPAFLLRSSPDPPARLLGQQAQVDGEAQVIWWLPFLALVQQGRFVRMQGCDSLTQQFESNAFYVFVSHARFELLLHRLGVVQSLGCTAVLLDDIADYFGRGWCSYEASLAGGYQASTLEVWNGNREPTCHSDSAEEAFFRVLRDRPYFLWRAILDTELFGVQTAEECMARLGLATTRPGRYSGRTSCSGWESAPCQAGAIDEAVQALVDRPAQRRR